MVRRGQTLTEEVSRGNLEIARNTDERAGEAHDFNMEVQQKSIDKLEEQTYGEGVLAAWNPQGNFKDNIDSLNRVVQSNPAFFKKAMNIPENIDITGVDGMVMRMASPVSRSLPSTGAGCRCCP